MLAVEAYPVVSGARQNLGRELIRDDRPTPERRAAGLERGPTQSLAGTWLGLVGAVHQRASRELAADDGAFVTSKLGVCSAATRTALLMAIAARRRDVDSVIPATCGVSATFKV